MTGCMSSLLLLGKNGSDHGCELSKNYQRYRYKIKEPGKLIAILYCQTCRHLELIDVLYCIFAPLVVLCVPHGFVS